MRRAADLVAAETERDSAKAPADVSYAARMKALRARFDAECEAAMVAYRAETAPVMASYNLRVAVIESTRAVT